MSTTQPESIRSSQSSSIKSAHASTPSGRADQVGTVTSMPSVGQVNTTVRASGSGPNASKNRCGFVLRRRYRLDVLSARSALGEHYQAFDLLRRKSCRIKLARLDSGLAKLADERLRHEAGILARLSHPNIIEARELNIDESGITYLVLESIDGKSLVQHLQNKGPLPLSEAMEILRGICGALGRAHEVGVVHGDLRPGCIMLQKPQKESSRNGESDSLHGDRVKLIDFELALEQGSCGDELEEVIPTYVLMGSLPYRAPEALVGDPRGLSPRSDIWSVAVIAYQMLSGRLPFASEDTRALSEQISFADPEPLSQLVTDLPAAVHDAIMTALSKSRCLRFASVSELMRALEGKSPPSASDHQQKGGPTGLFQVTAELLADCRQADTPSLGVPVMVVDEDSTRRYPRADYPQALLQEKSELETEGGEILLPPNQVMVSQEGTSTGRLLILGLALLSVLFSGVFMIGFVMAQRLRSGTPVPVQSACATEREQDIGHDAELAEEEDLFPLKEVSHEEPLALAELLVPVAPPPIARSVIRPPVVQPSREPRPIPPLRRAKAVESEEGIDIESLPPPADAPPFASEKRAETPAPLTVPADESKDREPLRVQVMD